MVRQLWLLLFVLAGTSWAPGQEPVKQPWIPLFTEDGIPEGWTVRQWNDVSLVADEGVHWRVRDGVLYGFDQVVARHDGTAAPPLKDRPRRGHIGFQELSRGGDQVMIRNARVRTLGG